MSTSGSRPEFMIFAGNSNRKLADAIAQSADFVDGQDFVVSLGDSTIKSSQPGNLLRRMIDVHRQTKAACVVAVQHINPADAFRYGIVSPRQEISEGVWELADLVEKPPAGQAPSDLAICARYIFSPVIFDAIKRTSPDRRGELQITDSMRVLVKEGHKVMAVGLIWLWLSVPAVPRECQ
jgi:UTP--glucose-1-phosphate uridylyltransferase